MLDFLSEKGSLTNWGLEEIENIALAGDSLLHQVAGRLLIEVRHLRNELNDEAYQFAGSRIHRHAIVCRNATIERLQGELKAQGK